MRRAAATAAAGLLVLAALTVPLATISGHAAAPNAKLTATGFLAVTTGSGHSQISTFHLDGTGGKALTSGTANHYGPSVSPDGKQVLFVGEDGGAIEVYRMNIDGSGVTSITKPPATAGTATWSPDGSAIAYAGLVGQKYQVFLAAPDGTNSVQLTHDSAASSASPVFSPDGALIAYSSTTLDTTGGGSVPKSRVWVMNAKDGSAARALTAGSGDAYPAWIDKTALLFARTSDQGKASAVISVTLAGVEKAESPADRYITEPRPLPGGKSYGATLLTGTSFGLVTVTRSDGAALAAVPGSLQLLASTTDGGFVLTPIVIQDGDVFNIAWILVEQPVAATTPAAGPGTTPTPAAPSVPWVPILIAVVALIAVGVGVYVMVKPKKDCSKERDRVAQLQARLARDLADQAASAGAYQDHFGPMIENDQISLAEAEEQLARCEGTFTPATPPVPTAVAPPVKPPPPVVPPAPPPPPPPPVAPAPPVPVGTTPPPTPPPPPTQEKPKDKPKPPPPHGPECSDGDPPIVEVLASAEVEFFVLSKAKIEIGGTYQAGEKDIDAAIDGLDKALLGANLGAGLIGAVTDPVGSILGTLGVPSADDATGQAADAAAKGVGKIGDRLKDLQKIGQMWVGCPRQRFRVSCVVTKECQGGNWVITDRSLKLTKLGKSTLVVMSNAPFIHGIGDLGRAGAQIENWAAGYNRAGEKKMRELEKSCSS